MEVHVQFIGHSSLKCCVNQSSKIISLQRCAGVNVKMVDGALRKINAHALMVIGEIYVSMVSKTPHRSTTVIVSTNLHFVLSL